METESCLVASSFTRVVIQGSTELLSSPEKWAVQRHSRELMKMLWEEQPITHSWLSGVPLLRPVAYKLLLLQMVLHAPQDAEAATILSLLAASDQHNKP